MLRQLPPFESPDLLVGAAARDDAAVYRLSAELALVLTVDLFPPIVDDPYSYGAIAAANAFSDVYAMGGVPKLALNILCFPVELAPQMVPEILRGGADKAKEAGVLIVGGHTLDDREPKYGMAVTGTVAPGQQVELSGARPGDLLVLTKPLGTGIITTAAKNNEAEARVLEGAIQWMAQLNRGASQAMVRVGVNACTDITGFGLLGHLQAMAQASQVAARVQLSRVPVMEGTWALAEAGTAPGGTHRNHESLGPWVTWHPEVGGIAQLVLCDAQTSGGLLIAVPAAKASTLLEELGREAVPAWVVGEVTGPGDGQLAVLP